MSSSKIQVDASVSFDPELKSPLTPSSNTNTVKYASSQENQFHKDGGINLVETT